MRRPNLCLLLAFISLSRTLAAAEPRVQVFCPAINQDNDDRNKSVPSGPGRVAVIAIGTVRKTPGGNEKDVELVVDRTLFGPGWKRLPLSEVDIPDPPKPMIYCLSWARDGTGFKFTVSRHYHKERIFPVEEEPALSAMGQARTDALVLGSEAIFVARLIPDPAKKDEGTTGAGRASPNRSNRDRIITATVDRLLSDTGPRPGDTVRILKKDDRLPTGAARLYFCSRADADEPSGGHIVYTVLQIWPDSEIAQVEAALKRRTLFPIRESVDGSDRNAFSQEITFQGTRAAAIGLLGSSFDAAQTHGARRLITDGPVAIPEVAAFVEANLFRTELVGATSFRQQKNLI